MKRKLLSILALLCLTVTSAWAESWTSGDCPVTLSGDVLTVSKTSGTGAMADYANANAQPWKDSRSSITSIVVGEGVTHIGNNAFRLCSYATSISLPTTLETIGNYAFHGCSNADLKSITIPENVTTIGQSAFRVCNGLTSVTIPASVTSIGGYAFYNCRGLTSVTIGNSVTSIGNYAFNACSNLTTVTLNSNPTIGTDAFAGIADGAAVTMNLTANSAGGAYWATFYNQNYDFEADANTKVFKAALTDTELELTELTTDQTVTKNNAVILKSTASPIVMTLTSTASSIDFSSNSLQGVSDAGGLTAADPSTTFVLNNGTGGVGFYRLATGKTLGVGKAYLTYDGALAPEFLGFSFGETTNIQTTNFTNYTNNKEYYDLQGRRVQNPSKGLYIVNGKKVVIK